MAIRRSLGRTGAEISREQISRLVNISTECKNTSQTAPRRRLGGGDKVKVKVTGKAKAKVKVKVTGKANVKVKCQQQQQHNSIHPSIHPSSQCEQHLGCGCQ
jgi:hypothetical protein